MDGETTDMLIAEPDAADEIAGIFIPEIVSSNCHQVMHTPCDLTHKLADVKPIIGPPTYFNFCDYLLSGFAAKHSITFTFERDFFHGYQPSGYDQIEHLQFCTVKRATPGQNMG